MQNEQSKQNLDKDLEKDQPTVGRRALLTSMSVAAVAGLAAGAASSSQAQTQTQTRTHGGAGFQPARHAQDAWMDELPGSHRVFIDSATSPGGASALWYANNILSSHEESYGGKASDYAMIVCFRHMSTPFGFDDGIWAKYGGLFNRNADPAPTTNPMNTASGVSGQNSIGNSAARGVQFAICSRATRRFAMVIAQSTGATVDEVFDELVAGGIPNSHFVPAGVVAATRAQEFGYSFMYGE